MTGELEKIWKEMIISQSRHCANIHVEGVRKATMKLRVTEIRTERKAKLLSVRICTMSNSRVSCETLVVSKLVKKLFTLTQPQKVFTKPPHEAVSYIRLIHPHHRTLFL
jgi:hypothetical protein